MRSAFAYAEPRRATRINPGVHGQLSELHPRQVQWGPDYLDRLGRFSCLGYWRLCRSRDALRMGGPIVRQLSRAASLVLLRSHAEPSIGPAKFLWMKSPVLASVDASLLFCPSH